MGLKDGIAFLERMKSDAQALQEEAREELARRVNWNREFDEKTKRLGEGGVPGFDADDPVL